MSNPSAGLEGVVAAQSKICSIDGKKGKLYYRGYPIEDLVRYSSFEEVMYLLWEGGLPDTTTYEEFRKDFQNAGSTILSSRLDSLVRFGKKLSPMDMLRTMVSLTPALFSPKTADRRELALHLVSLFSIVVAAHERITRSLPLAYPKSHFMSYAENFLYMLHGKFPDPESARVLDRALILHADHEFNASTFAARVIIATKSDIYSALTGAIGSLKGSLHGGANEEVMKLLDDISSQSLNASQVEQYIKGKLQRKERIPGFGHRVYKVVDPRAKILRNDAKRILQGKPEYKLFEIAECIREIMEKEKEIFPNVDYYSGLLYVAIGIPPRLFTPLFAMARSAGWIAHVFEQEDNNRLIRPIADYVGSAPRKYPKRM